VLSVGQRVRSLHSEHAVSPPGQNAKRSPHPPISRRDIESFSAFLIAVAIASALAARYLATTTVT
jgi:hypothetical protein